MYTYTILSGHQVVQIRLILRAVSLDQSFLAGSDHFVAYVQRFDIVPQVNAMMSGSLRQRGPYREPATNMYILERARRADGTFLGDVVPLSWIRSLVDLAPRLRETADTRLSKETTMEYSTEFFLNHHFDKEIFFAIY